MKSVLITLNVLSIPLYAAMCLFALQGFYTVSAPPRTLGFALGAAVAFVCIVLWLRRPPVAAVVQVLIYGLALLSFRRNRSLMSSNATFHDLAEMWLPISIVAAMAAAAGIAAVFWVRRRGTSDHSSPRG